MQLLMRKNSTWITWLFLSAIAWQTSHAAPQLNPLEPKSLDEQLEDAAWRSSYEDVVKLLNAGANANAKVRGGLSTPLHRAASKGRIDVIKLLIKHGADVNADAGHGRIPLVEAVMHPSPDGLKLLLDSGAKPNGAALANVCIRRQFTIEKAQLLLDAGAPANAAMNAAAHSGNIDLLKLLLRHGADVNGTDEQGNTALHGAAQGGIEIARFLLEQGSDVNLATHDGNTPLHRAVENGPIELTQMLLDAKANPSKRNDQLVSPTRHAAIRGRKPTYDLLVKATGGKERFEPVDASHRDGKTVEQLIKIATSDDYKARMAACLGLVSYGEESAQAVAIAFGEDLEKNGQLFDVLARLGPQAKAALPTLEKLLTDEEAVVTAFALFPRMLPGHLKQLPESTKKVADELLLSKIMNARTESEMLADFYANRLSDASAIKLLEPKPRLVQLAARLALERPGTELSKRATLAQLRTANDEKAGFSYRTQALSWLGRKENVEPEVVETLWRIVREAPRPMPIQQTDAQAWLNGKAPDPNPPRDAQTRNVRHRQLALTAGSGLGRTIAKEQLDDLLPMLTPIDNHLRPGALAALKTLKPELTPELIKLLQHKDDAIAVSASVALAHRPKGIVVEPLLAAMDGFGDRGKIQALLVLAQSPHTEGKNKLLEIAGENSNPVSVRAAAASGLIRMQRILTPAERKQLLADLPEFAKCVKDETSPVRIRFLGDLQVLGAEAAPALPELKRYMKENPLPKYKDDPKRWHELHPISQAIFQIESAVTEQADE